VVKKLFFAKIIFFEIPLYKINFLFVKTLLQWHIAQNGRLLPWKNETDPYKIWISEILLQQTKAEAVIPYYLKFTTNFPTVFHLANASEQVVFNMWQGLGYYSRCRNVLATAKYIVHHYNGIFPDTYDAIISLKGIGPYTAAAISSFAFGLPYAVLDGNVFRVLSRVFAIDTPIDTVVGKKFFQQLAQQLLSKNNAASFNQAIMDFGATVCKPKAAICNTCVMHPFCKAYQTKTVYTYPIKTKKISSKTRHFHYLVFDDGKNLYLHKREHKDVWQDLYEFDLQESTSQHLPFNPEKDKLQPPIILSQQLTHQKIIGYFYIVPAFTNQPKLIKVKYNKLHQYPMPKLILDFLRSHQYINLNN
jgi:A/G-specific adenine glycosylase